MAIIRRQQQELTEAEMAAIVKFFKENQELDPKFEVLNANKLEAALHYMGCVIDAESIQAAFEALRKAGDLKIITAEKKKFDAAVKRGSYVQSHVNVVFAFLKSMHLIHDPKDQRSYENAALVLDGMLGRDFTTENMRFVTTYAQSHGTKLHWEERRDPDRPAHYGRYTPDDPDAKVRFMPREETNRGFLPSHSSNPRFNGEKERLEREEARKRLNQGPEDPLASNNAIWRMQAKALSGNTHSETARIQAVVDSTPGGWLNAYRAGKAELKRIENERARSR